MSSERLRLGARLPWQHDTPLVRMVRERGLRHFAFFFVTGEGEDLPNGDEEKSGYVIDEHGRIYSFWTGWDGELRKPVFSARELVRENPAWLESDEYRRARATANVGAPISASSTKLPE